MKIEERDIVNILVMFLGFMCLNLTLGIYAEWESSFATSTTTIESVQQFNGALSSHMDLVWGCFGGKIIYISRVSDQNGVSLL